MTIEEIHEIGLKVRMELSQQGASFEPKPKRLPYERKWLRHVAGCMGSDPTAKMYVCMCSDVLKRESRDKENKFKSS